MVGREYVSEERRREGSGRVEIKRVRIVSKSKRLAMVERVIGGRESISAGADVMMASSFSLLFFFYFPL